MADVSRLEQVVVQTVEDPMDFVSTVGTLAVERHPSIDALQVKDMHARIRDRSFLDHAEANTAGILILLSMVARRA